MKITIESLEFPLSVKEKLMKIPKISKLHIEFVNGKNIHFDKTKVIEDIVNNLKPAPIVKNTHLISSNDLETINDYIKDVKSTTKSVKSVNNLNYIMDKYEQDINNHENQINELNDKLDEKQNKINELEVKLNKENEDN